MWSRLEDRPRIGRAVTRSPFLSRQPERLATDRADLAVLREPTHHHLVYHHGVNPVRHVVKGGTVVVRDGVRVA